MYSYGRIFFNNTVNFVQFTLFTIIAREPMMNTIFGKLSFMKHFIKITLIFLIHNFYFSVRECTPENCTNTSILLWSLFEWMFDYDVMQSTRSKIQPLIFKIQIIPISFLFILFSYQPVTQLNILRISFLKYFKLCKY